MTIAFWCVLIAALMPYIFTGIAKSQRNYDNAAPRQYLEQTHGFRKRAHWAQLNAFEAFPPFAAGVIIAHITGVPGSTVDLIASCFIIARLFYGLCYVKGWSSFRTLFWTIGLISVIALFVTAGLT